MLDLQEDDQPSVEDILADLRKDDSSEEKKNQPDNPTVNPELVSYASELTNIQGGYEAADLEAAGFTNEEIQAYSDSIGQEMQEPKGDGSKLYLGVPGTDMYDGLKIGYKEDSFENREPDAEVSAFEIYNAYADNENTVIDPTTGNLTYNDPVSAQSFIVYYPSRSGTSVPIIQDVWNEAVRRLRPDYYADKPAGVNEGTRLINEVTDSLTNTVEFVAALGDLSLIHI